MIASSLFAQSLMERRVGALLQNRCVQAALQHFSLGVLMQCARVGQIAHSATVVASEYGRHQVAQRVVAKVGADVRNPQPLSRGERPRGRMLERGEAQTSSSERTVLGVLGGNRQREVSAERISHRMERLDRRQSS